MDSLQLLGQKKKCLVMISWHSTDDPVDDIFEFAVTRPLKWYKILIWGWTFDKKCPSRRGATYVLQMYVVIWTVLLSLNEKHGGIFSLSW